MSLFRNKYISRLKDIVSALPEFYIAIGSFFRFILVRTGKKAVLIVEPNAGHGEILPGLCKYFEDLGYDVFLLCRRFIISEGVFCRYPNKPMMFAMPQLLMKFALKVTSQNAFDFLLITSMWFSDSRYRIYDEFINYLKFIPKSRHGCFYVEHHFDPDKKSYATDKSDMFLLTRNTLNGKEVPMLNPHYFGEVKLTILSQVKRVFIFVGAVSSKKSSIQKLCEAVRQLEKTFEFEVWLVGKGADSSLSDSLPSSVKTFGRLPFNEMYGLLEKADFSLPLLDPGNDEHKHYLQGVTSGTRQLILGFLKVPVIHEAFAKRYDFSEKDAILHEDGGLIIAMERALTMTENEYSNLQKGLEILSRSVYKKSLENLKKRVDERILASSH